MIRLVVGSDFADPKAITNSLLDWAGQRMPLGRLTAEDWGKAAAMGVADLETRTLLAVLVFHDYKPNNDIMLSMAADSPRWITRGVLAGIFDYPFNQLSCRRVTTINGRRNRRARKLAEGIGFRLEGVARKGYDGAQDAMIYGMLREDCRWLYPKVTHGQAKRTIAA